MLSAYSRVLLTGEPLLPRLRLPIIVLSLLSIGYCAFFLGAWVPNFLLDVSWRPDGVLRVVQPYPGTQVADLFQADDIILAIDGAPARRLPLRPLFVPRQEAYTYTIWRGGETFTVEAATGRMTPSLLYRRLASIGVALGAWLVATLIVLYATPLNGDGWTVGLVTMGLAVAIAAAEAALYGVPLTWLASEPFLPFLAVAFAQLAFLPRQGSPSRQERRFFGILYTLAAGLGLASLVEILYLTPQGTSVERLSGVSLSAMILLVLGLGLLLHPLILLTRVFHMPASYHRRQVVVLVVATSLAIAPLVLLTILPNILLGSAWLPWEISLALLLINPAAYGYVILRRHYLNLDIFATRTIYSLLLMLFVLLLFAGFLSLLTHQKLLPISDPLASTLSFSVALLGVTVGGAPFRRAASLVIYGKEASYEEHLTRFAETLSADPQFDTLRRVFQDLLTVLQIRQGALLLTGRDGALHLFAASRLTDGCTPPIEGIGHLPVHPVLRAAVSKERTDLAPLFAHAPWVEGILPLFSRNRLVGLILLGAQVPDGCFNAQEVSFMKQVAGVMSVAAEAGHLFESSLAMSRDLLQTRDLERIRLAAAIHDDPLQRISLVAAALDHLAHTDVIQEAQLQEMVCHQCRELLGVADQLRALCSELHPPILAQGIQWAVKEVVYDVQRDSSLDVQLVVAVPATCQIPAPVSRAIYHVLVEALNNVRKHAQATTAWVRLALQDDVLCLTVADLVRSQHFGLVGMHEWVNLAGGTLTLDPQPDGGTQVVATFPLSEQWMGEPQTNTIREMER
jgi:signal transduction histidine kinase